MNRITICRATAIALLLPLLNSCGGGGAAGVAAIVEAFVPVFINQWKGVTSDFEVVEYQFTPSAENVESGTFVVADSTVRTGDRENNTLSSFEIQGSFNERTFTFDTLDSTGAVVASYNGSFVDRDTIRITPTQPAGTPYLLHQIVDQVSFIPSIEAAWGDNASTYVLNLNPGFFEGIEVAIFTGSEHSANGVADVEGYFVSDHVFFRSTLDGLVTELSGNFTGVDAITASGRSLVRGGMGEPDSLVQVDLGVGVPESLYFADSFDRDFTEIVSNVDRTWRLSQSGNHAAAFSFDEPEGLMTVSLAVPVSPAVDVSTGLGIVSADTIGFSRDELSVAWSGFADGVAERGLFVAATGVESSGQRVSGGRAVTPGAWEWSPDSTLLAYAFGGSGSGGIALYNPALQSETVLGFPAGEYRDIAWSPSANHVSARHLATQQVYIALTDGSPAVPANRNAGENTGFYAWLPQFEESYVYESINASVSNLYVADAANPDNDRALTANLAGQFQNEAIAPNGSYVAWHHPGSSAGDGSLFVAEVDQVNEQTFFQGYETNFAFAPDGNRLVYYRRATGTAARELLAVDLASAASSFLIVPADNTAGAIREVAWSPDGDHLVIRKGLNTSDDSLLVASGLSQALPANLDAVPLIPDPVDNDDILNLRWERTSQRVLFTAVFGRINRPDAVSVGRNGLGRLALRRDDVGTGSFQRIETLP